MVGRVAGPVAARTMPGLTASFVLQAFDRAVDGVGPLKSASQAADERLHTAGGDVDKAVKSLVDSHVKLAGAQGFVTNLGGLVAMAVMIPANLSGLALLQCHLVAGIAHLRGYDLADPRVRSAVLACLLGEESVQALVKKHKLPSSPMAIATAPHHDPDLARKIAVEVTTDLIGRIAGKRSISVIARRVPVLGGGVGAVADGYNTYEIGVYAAKQLKHRHS